MDWKPWEVYEDVEEDSSLPIPEPPCKECFWWQPRALTNYYPESRKSTLSEIRCCWVREMFNDFSCYKPKGEMPNAS